MSIVVAVCFVIQCIFKNAFFRNLIIKCFLTRLIICKLFSKIRRQLIEKLISLAKINISKVSCLPTKSFIKILISFKIGVLIFITSFIRNITTRRSLEGVARDSLPSVIVAFHSSLLGCSILEFFNYECSKLNLVSWPGENNKNFHQNYFKYTYCNN